MLALSTTVGPSVTGSAVTGSADGETTGSGRDASGSGGIRMERSGSIGECGVATATPVPT
jgi:hypothetical protein